MAAFFWVGVPIYLCFSGSVPFQYDAAVLTLGGLWVEARARPERVPPWYVTLPQA